MSLDVMEFIVSALGGDYLYHITWLSDLLFSTHNCWCYICAFKFIVVEFIWVLQPAIIGGLELAWSHHTLLTLKCEPSLLSAMWERIIFFLFYWMFALTLEGINSFPFNLRWKWDGFKKLVFQDVKIKEPKDILKMQQGYWQMWKLKNAKMQLKIFSSFCMSLDLEWAQDSKKIA